MTVEAKQRHTKRSRCPICDGADGDPRGQEKRCSGFTSSDGEFAHCSREELAGGLDQENGGTFAHRLHGPCKCGQTHGPDRRPVSREVVATYVYENAERAPLFRVVRTAGKDFYQQHRDSAGEWQNGRNGVAPTLYRLAELVADDADRSVYIVEGEKDVETLEKRGFLATTSPGGAGKWHHVADVAKTVLQGRDVVVIADNDKAGRQHARDIAATLRGVARTLRVVRCPSTKDVTDHLAAGGTMTMEQFVDLGAEDAGVQPTAQDPLRGLEHLRKVAVIGRQALQALAGRPVHYVWALIAVAGTIILLAGGPGEGKTTLLFLLLAARVNKGAAVHVLGRLVEPALPGMFLVLIEGEHSESSAARKLLRSLRLLGVDDSALDRVILVARKAVRLGSPEWLDIVKLIAAGLVSDIGIDTVARVAPADGDNEREQTAIFEVVAQAIEAAPTEETKPTVWAAAHTRKNNRSGDVSDVAGSVQRVGQADSVLMMAGEKVEGRTVASRVTFGKLREEPDEYPLPVTFSIVGNGIRVTTSTGEGEDNRPLETRIVELLAHGKKTKSALSTALGRNGDAIEEAITKLFATRQIATATMEIRGRSYKAFTLRLTPDSTPDSTSRPTTPDSRQTNL